MKKVLINIFSVIIFLCLSIPLFSQSNVQLAGIITDAKTGKPLGGASIFIHDIKLGTISENDGNYIIKKIPAGKYLVEVTYIGYATVIENVDIKSATTKNFLLQQAAVEQEAVTVTGVASATKVKQTPQPISIIKRADLLHTTSTNIIDALSKSVPGVTSLSTGPAISKPVIRGLGYNRVVVINDGIRQEGQQWGDEHGIEIDEFSIQKAEILKGPASLMYGSDAMAGVVNLMTNLPVEQGTIKGNILGSFIDNNNMYGVNGNVAGNLKNGFNWNVYGTYKSAADYKNQYDGKVFNSRFNERNFGGYIGLNKSWGYSHLLISNFNQKLGVVEGTRDATTGQFLIFSETPYERIATNDELNSRELFTPYQHVQHFKIATDNNIQIGKGRLIFSVGYQRNQRQEFGNPVAPSTPDLYFNLQTINYNVQYSFAEAKGWKTTIGANGMYQQNQNLASEVLIPEYNLFDAGIFIFTKKSFTDKLTVSGGIRGDIRTLDSKLYMESGNVKFAPFKKNFENITGSIGLAYNVNKEVTLKFNAARAYRAPSIAELATNGVHEGTNRYEYGDVNLKTETSFQLDGGVEVNTTHVTFSVNAFYNNIQNYIFYRKLESTNGGDSLVNNNGNLIQAFKFNQNNATLAGLEFNFDIHPHPLDWLHFENTFSFVAGTFNQSFEGSNKLPFMPPPHWVSELKTDFKKAGSSFSNLYFKIEADNVFTQNRVFTAYNTETPTQGYTLLNFGTGADILSKGKALFSVYLSLNNAADVAYQNHLSRLKYTDVNVVTGREGVFNMGRNFNLKINVPLSFNLK
jgi:iron complex outermembrane receptor protein